MTNPKVGKVHIGPRIVGEAICCKARFCWILGVKAAWLQALEVLSTETVDNSVYKGAHPRISSALEVQWSFLARLYILIKNYINQIVKYVC